MKQPHVMAYLNELAAQIAIDGGFEGKDVVAVIKAAHKKRRDFIVEMINQQTDRSVMAKMALSTSVYISLVAKEEVERFSRRVSEFAVAKAVREERETMGFI